MPVLTRIIVGACEILIDLVALAAFVVFLLVALGLSTGAIQ